MKKSTWIVVGLVIILGLIYFLTNEQKVSVGIKRMKLPTFSKSQVDKIIIDGGDKVVLSKVDGSWKIAVGSGDSSRLVDADQSNVDSMLDAALSISHSHYVTELTEKFEELGITGSSAVKVSIASGDKNLWALILGKNAASSGRYAKLDSNNDVHVVRGSFWQLTRKGINEWRERKIFHLDEGSLVSVNFDHGGKSGMLIAKSDQDNSWSIKQSSPSMAKDFRLDANKIKSLALAVQNLRASNFIDEEKSLTKPELQLTLNTKDEKSYSLAVYAGEKDKFFVKKSDNPQIFEVSSLNIERIKKKGGRPKRPVFG